MKSGRHRRDGGASARVPVSSSGGNREWLYGRQSVLECLRAGRRKVYRLLMALNRPPNELSEFRKLALAHGVSVELVELHALDRFSDGGHHQGVAAEAAPYLYANLDELLEADVQSGRVPFVLLADHIQDPQNLGAILRTADAAGVTAVVIPKDRACAVTPAVVRASSGAAEHVSVALVVNLVQTMLKLKKQGVWLYGLDMNPEARRYDQENLTGPVGLVVGNEGVGLGRLVGETCDGLLTIPMSGRVASLNASVSAALAMFEVVRQRACAGRSCGGLGDRAGV